MSESTFRAITKAFLIDGQLFKLVAYQKIFKYLMI